MKTLLVISVTALLATTVAAAAQSAGQGSASGQQGKSQSSTDAGASSDGTNPKKGQLLGGGDPNLLKNGTGNAQSPAVATGGPTTPGSNPTSK